MEIESLNPTVVVGLLIASFTVLTIACIIYRAKMKDYQFRLDGEDLRTKRYQAERAADDARFQHITAQKLAARDASNLTNQE